MNLRGDAGRVVGWLVTMVVSVAGVVAAHLLGWLRPPLAEMVAVDVVTGSLVWFWLVPRMIDRR